MKIFKRITLIILFALLFAHLASAQRSGSHTQNAALRYWAAFSEVQDSGISDQQAQALNRILDGTAPYDEAKYRDLLVKNALPLEIMARATSLPHCDWGLDYGLGHDLPVDYAKKALVLGRLNVLYAFHLFGVAKKDEAVRALVAGLRFSDDVGNGGSLFATLIAKSLLVSHLRAVDEALRREQLSPSQRAQLQKSTTRLGKGLDWSTAATLDLESLRGDYSEKPQSSAALTRIISSYVAALNDDSKLPALDQAVHDAPADLANLIPDAKRVLEQKRDLNNTLTQTRAHLQ